MKQIYLDHNATAPILPEVASAVAQCHAQGYGNPASQHRPGRRARQVLEDAREGIARLLGAELASARPDRLIFTSGGTEANNLAVLGLAGQERAHAVVSAIEHPSVIGPADYLERRGWQVDRLGVSGDGVVEAQRLADLLRADTRLVSVMLGNNETGVLQPVRRLAEICAGAAVPLHTDAVQVVGKLPVNFRSLGVAAMTTSAHKFHGPVGIGALVVRHGVELEPHLRGGFQQAGLRPGTEPVALAAGMLAALELWHRQREAHIARMTALRDQFEGALTAACPELVIHGAAAERLPHTSNISFPGADRQALVVALDLAGVACSTGSACASGSSEPSATLVAMGCPKAVLDGSVRFSLGRATSPAEVSEAVCLILRIYNDLRARSGTEKMAGLGRIGGGILL